MIQAARCSNCMHWHSRDERQGFCLAEPPEVMGYRLKRSGDSTGEWPTTGMNAVCGRHPLKIAEASEAVDKAIRDLSMRGTNNSGKDGP